MKVSFHSILWRAFMLHDVLYRSLLSVDDKSFLIGHVFKFERRCNNCFKKISKAVVSFSIILSSLT